MTERTNHVTGLLDSSLTLLPTTQGICPSPKILVVLIKYRNVAYYLFLELGFIVCFLHFMHIWHARHYSTLRNVHYRKRRNDDSQTESVIVDLPVTYSLHSTSTVPVQWWWISALRAPFFIPSPHSVHCSPGSPHPAHITSSQSPPSLSSPITASTFHSRLKTHLFYKSFPP